MVVTERAAGLALAGLLLAGAGGVTAAPGEHRPNVVLIITDDQGYGDLGLHGNEKIRTPNLDRLGRESVRLTRFYASPVCAPTRASLMTGRYNYRTGVVDTFLGRAMMHGDEVTLAEMLGEGGYRTGIFGKWHLGDNYPLRSIDQGFQESLVHGGGGIGQPSDPPDNHYQDPVLQHNGRPVKRPGYCTDLFTDAAIRFIEKNHRRPFFAYLATNAPHTPLEIAEEKVAPYRAMGLDETTARVYAMVENVDQNVGRLLARLEELELARDTIVVFLTDNGPQQNRYRAGMRGLKGSVYEGGIHVPCFVRWPVRLKPGTVDRIAAHIDLAPTLLEACGVTAPSGRKLDGRSLLPLLAGKNAPWQDRTLFFQWHRGDAPEAFRASAAVGQRFKLVDGKELYDLQSDPAEERDVAAEHPLQAARLRRAYEEWFRDVSATRGYDPPRIALGSPKENPTTLTRQDWRGPRAGWTPTSLGHWEVSVLRPGTFDVTVRLAPEKREREAVLRLGKLELRRAVTAGAREVRFEGVSLPQGEGRLEAWAEADGQSVGALYVDVRRR